VQFVLWAPILPHEFDIETHNKGMAKLRSDLPRNQWIDGRLFIHDNGFFVLARGRSKWMFFLPGWVVLYGDSRYDTEHTTAIPLLCWTLGGARKMIDQAHQEVEEEFAEQREQQQEEG